MKTKGRRPATLSRSALNKQLGFLTTLMQRELALITQNPLVVYRRLRLVGKLWKRIKNILTPAQSEHR